MRMDDIVTAVIETWRRDGIRLNPGATDGSLRKLSAALEAELPADVVRFFVTADGLEDTEAAEWLTNFWSIEKILSRRLERRGRDQAGEYRELAFADVMLDSWHLWFRVRSQGQLSVFVEGMAEECNSLSEALERHVAAAKVKP